jgi:CubicO group peptidase (beta-lactamase class C family)
MRRALWTGALVALLWPLPAARAEDRPARPDLANVFPQPESKGGWQSLLPDNGDPNAKQKAAILKEAGVDWDQLYKAWDYNAANGGDTGLLVVRKGRIVGEWYQNCDRARTFNIYSSSKAYTSLAFGLLLADSDAGKLPMGRKLTLDTRVCNADWLPQCLPLSDPRKADITLRHLLNMLSGIGPEPVPTDSAPFETALGKTDNSPFAKLKSDPGKAFNYSNAGVAHLVLLFHNATGGDLYPYLKERVFGPVGMEAVTWQQIGGRGKLGPLSQGYSGILTTAREHARFCQLALHRGEWAGRRVVPAEYYDFAWKGTDVKPDYGAQWWVYPRHKDAPRDLVQTAGARNNHGYVVPSLDLVFVRVGDAQNYPKDFEQELVRRVLAAVK